MYEEMKDNIIFDAESEGPDLNSKRVPIRPDTHQQHVVRIALVGAGGAGGNALKRFSTNELPDNIEFIAINTDNQALSDVSAHVKIPIGKTGQGAGGHTYVGEEAARDAEEELRSAIANKHMVILTAGMGGGTGTGALPVVAEIAKEMDILTLAIVYTPFDFEGKITMRNAREGLSKLRGNVDTLIEISNQTILEKATSRLTVDDSFEMADISLKNAVEAVSHIINDHGTWNVDFQDLKSITKDRGTAVIGIGEGSGENKMQEAIKQALSHPLLEDYDISGSEGLLIYYISGKDGISLKQMGEINDNITDLAPDSNIKIGWATDPSKDDYVKVVLIATGFPQPGESRHHVRARAERQQPKQAKAKPAQSQSAPNPTQFIDLTEIPNDLDVEHAEESLLDKEAPFVQVGTAAGNNQRKRNTIVLPKRLSLHSKIQSIVSNNPNHKRLD